MNRTVLAGVGAALVVAGVVGMGAVQARTNAAAAEPTGATGAPAWLHVRVDEHGKSSKVRVNVPMTVVEAALEAAPRKIVDKGRIKIDLGHDGDDHDLSLAEMRKIWQSLKDAGDTEVVSVEQEDETVRVARKGDLVQVRVSKPGGKEEVHVDVPVTLVDAILAGTGDSVDVKAVIRELRGQRGDIVRVNDENSAVRIWIDESAAGEAR